MAIPLSDDERYAVFRELHLLKKPPGWIEIEIHDKPGPPKHIIPKGDLPLGTIAQHVFYWIKQSGGGRWLLVKAHQYRLPNGTIKGGPDPLFIRLNDVVLRRTEGGE